MMDAFSLIILLALGACVVLHLFGHGHGHGRGQDEHAAHIARGESRLRSADDAESDIDRNPVAAGSRDRHQGGCH